jgi:hypothetical protein
LILLRAKKHEPNDRHGGDGDTDTHDEKQKNGRARLGLPGFRRCFDDYAVLFDSHNQPLDFRCEVGAVEYRHLINILRNGPGRGVFRALAQCFVGCIQAIQGFVCPATGVVRPRRNLFSCIDAGKWWCFVHALILCWRPSRPRGDGSYRLTRSFALGSRRL